MSEYLERGIRKPPTTNHAPRKPLLQWKVHNSLSNPCSMLCKDFLQWLVHWVSSLTKGVAWLMTPWLGTLEHLVCWRSCTAKDLTPSVWVNPQRLRLKRKHGQGYKMQLQGTWRARLPGAAESWEGEGFKPSNIWNQLLNCEILRTAWI